MPRFSPRPSAPDAVPSCTIGRCTCTSSASAAPSWAASPRSRARPATRVTGCDANVYPPMSDQLRALGIELIEGYGADAARRCAPDLFVVGNAIVARQPADGGDPRRRPALHQRPAVAGRARARGPPRAGRRRHARQDHHHRDAGLDPRAGRPRSRASWSAACRSTSASRRGSAATRGARTPFVIEADEYDTAFFDKRSKFVHYRPRTAILNNLEFDHADIFPDLAAIETPVPPPRAHRAGAAAGWSSTRARRRCSACWRRGCWSEVQRFGARKEEPGALRARGEPHAFDVLRGALKIARVEWPLLGEHNQLNALAAIARGRARRRRARRPRRGARRRSRTCARRLELRGEAGGVARLRRLRAPPDRDPHHHRRPAPQGRRARASSPCSSRARTR